MKLTIISTPIHDALGITTVSASVEAEARRIANLDFASFLVNTDALAVALYGSHPSVRVQYLSLPVGDYRKDAAEKAQYLHQFPDLVTREGYFCRQLRTLLEIGHHNSDHGTKLVPVFAYAIEHKDKYRLGASLIDDIQRFLAKRDFVDGFTIIAQTDDTCTIMPSLWRKGVA